MRIPWSMPDISGIFLIVLADNIKAMQLYKKCRFIEVCQTLDR